MTEAAPGIPIMVDGDGPATTQLVALAEVSGVSLTRVSDAPIPERAVVIHDPRDAEHTRQLLAALPPSVTLAICTTTASVTDVAAGSPAPEQVVGLHISPATPTPQLVEVVRALASADDAVRDVVDAAARLGLDAVIVPDRPGLLLDLVLRPYLNQVVQALDDGVASAKDIDAAIRLGLGYPIGPLALLDRMGIDAHLAATTDIWEQTGDPGFAPPALLRGMVAMGWTGTAAGRGLAINDDAEEADDA